MDIKRFRYGALIQGLKWQKNCWTEAQVSAVLEAEPTLITANYTEGGSTPLHVVCATWPDAMGVSMARLLLRARAEPWRGNNDGATPLYLAVCAEPGRRGNYARISAKCRCGPFSYGGGAASTACLARLFDR